MGYKVMEHFNTLQGEGSHAGKAAYFIRLGGCDVGCVWCDVKDSWDADAHPEMEVSEIVSHVTNAKARLAVITGGEPAMYDLAPLSDALHSADIKVHIETSGAYPLRGDIDWVCVSPKKFKAPLPECLQAANELKVVVYNRSDLDWALKHAAEVPESCELFLQPEWSREKEMSALIIDFVKSHPEWRLSLQTHKYLGID